MRDARRFKLLDGYRGIAALAVLLMHLLAAAPHVYVSGGYLAVDLFFMMSGFVITSAYEQQLLSGMTATEFMLRRIQRLFPLLVVGTLIAGGIHGFALNRIALLGMLRSAFLVPNIGLNATVIDLFDVNPSAWSLLFELVTNLIYALVARRLSSRFLALTILITGVVLVERIHHYGGADFGWSTVHRFDGEIRAAFGFFTGVALFRYRHHPRLAALSLRPSLAAATLALIFMWPSQPMQREMFDFFAVFVAFPILVIIGSNANVTGRTARICLCLGVISYPVYIVQCGPVAVAQAITHVHLSPLEIVRVVLAFGVLTVLIAYAALKLVDEPVQRWLKKRRSQRSGGLDNFAVGVRYRTIRLAFIRLATGKGMAQVEDKHAYPGSRPGAILDEVVRARRP